MQVVQALERKGVELEAQSTNTAVLGIPMVSVTLAVRTAWFAFGTTRNSNKDSMPTRGLSLLFSG